MQSIGVGSIGLRYQGSVIANKAAMYGKIVALCDVDKNVRDTAKAAFGSTPQSFEDYNDLIARKDVDVVTIGTPDHWHSKMLIDACLAGKDVYCEKPLTLTIDEGKAIRKAVLKSGSVVQVGSWQRSDSRFRLAVEMVKQGRIGKLQSVDVVLGKNVQGGPFGSRPVPKNFNWNLWQGQVADKPFIEERSHYTFRWWYEYSGGQMTDWGAHHLDIGQWVIGENPVRIETTAEFAQPASSSNNYFNVAKDFNARFIYPSGVVMNVSDSGRNGIMFNGSEGRIFVNRGTISGRPVEDLEKTPLPRESWNAYSQDNASRSLKAGKLEAIVNHMGNFFDCIETRQQPISDIESSHRSVTTCHLGNISMRLARSLDWDGKSESILNDTEAQQWQSREQRPGFETNGA